MLPTSTSTRRYDYQDLAETLAFSRDHFELVDQLLSSPATASLAQSPAQFHSGEITDPTNTHDTSEATITEGHSQPSLSTSTSASAAEVTNNSNNTSPAVTILKERWQKVLSDGSSLADWTYQHSRAQSAQVYDALVELAKYSDVRRPFRLSVIGQKGVGKSALVNALLGTGVQYTPSDVASKALSGTRIRLCASSTNAQPFEGHFVAGEQFSPPQQAQTVVTNPSASASPTPAGAGSSSSAAPAPAPTGPVSWQVVFLTPRRLWEVGTFLLNVARLPLPATPTNLNSLNSREAVITALHNSLTARPVAESEVTSGAGEGGSSGSATPNSANYSSLVSAGSGASSSPGDISTTQATAARKTLAQMLKVYRQHNKEQHIPDSYTLEIEDPSVDGLVSPYIRQEDSDLYLIVDYVRRFLPDEQAGLLAGRNIELEDVLGLDDPRDSFFALEAFRESFAVIMVFKCDRPLNSETTAILERLFSRDEGELARYGEVADLNKAIIVANRFDDILGNVSASQTTTDPLKAVEGIRRELARYSRQAQTLPIYLTSAAVATTAQEVLSGRLSGRPSSNYNHYLEGLSNLLQLVARRSGISGNSGGMGGASVGSGSGTTGSGTSMTDAPATATVVQYTKGGSGAGTGVEGAALFPLTPPDYLEFALSRQLEIETMSVGAATHQPTSNNNNNGSNQAQLILEMSGLPRLLARVEEALEGGSILRGRVANAEYYYAQAVAQTARCYARQMRAYGLDYALFSQPLVSVESRLFARFQREIRGRLDELDTLLREEWFNLSKRYIYGPQSQSVMNVRDGFLGTIHRVLEDNRQLIQLEQHIPSGQLVTDAWRKVFEDINDYLALEAGRQFRGLVAPLLGEIERVTNRLQSSLVEIASGGAGTLDEVFWQNYRVRLNRLTERLQTQAEMLAIGYYTDHRFSVYDEEVARTLHVGDAQRRREEVIRLLGDRVLSWFNSMWQLLCKMAMTDLNAFVGDVRYYVLGLPARDSLLVGLELAQRGTGSIAPDSSLVALLDYHYQADASFRRQYAMREPTPTERLTLEIRDWLGVITLPPLDGLAELGKAVALVGAGVGVGVGAGMGVGTSSAAADGGETPRDEYGADEATNTEGSQEAAPVSLVSQPANTESNVGGVGSGMRSGGAETELGRNGFGTAVVTPAAAVTSVTRVWPPLENQPGNSASATSSSFGGTNNSNTSTSSRYTRLSVPVESLHPYTALTRQYWEITNPDESAKSTRLHFSRIDLGQAQTSNKEKESKPARLSIEAFGRTHLQTIEGQHQDFWSKALPGRQLTVRFVADNSEPAWGFVLDGIETVS